MLEMPTEKKGHTIQKKESKELQPSTPQIHFKGMTVRETYKFCFGFFSIHDVSMTLVYWEEPQIAERGAK
jgi:hypothetical protein